MNSTNKRILFILSMIAIGSVFILIYLAALGNTDQVYNDLVVEMTSTFSSNKTIERNLIFILCLGGIAAYSLFCYFSYRKSSPAQEADTLFSDQKSKEFICALIAMTLSTLLITGISLATVSAALIFALILYVVDKELVLPGISVYFLGIYTFTGLYRLYVFAGGQQAANGMSAVLFAVIISLIPLLFPNKKSALLKLGLIENAIIPFNLLIFIANKYQYMEEIIVVKVGKKISFPIWLMILAFIAVAVYCIVKKWKIVDCIDEVIRYGTCVTIMIFNHFDGSGAVMPSDLHHTFENIIGYSQVFELGQTPFKNYIPVSGMYSIVQGFIFDFFGGGGTFANYNVTENLFYLFVIIAIVWLLFKQLDASYVLLISLVLSIQTYNRYTFILPIMLLLMWPKLIEKKNLWLIAWFLTSLFHGLYYPLFGAAVAIAFLPLAVWQIVTYAKSGALRSDLRSVKFWIGWVLCAILTLSCVGFLLGTLKHMLAMTIQSILADGLSRFGQTVFAYFFNYLSSHLTVRLSLYYIFTFIIPAAFVWVAYSLFVKSADVSVNDGKLAIGNPKTALIFISVTIMPLVCYTFTTTRLDIDSIYARSTGILFAGGVLLMLLSFNYIKNGKIRLLVVLFAVFLPAVTSSEGIYSIEGNIRLKPVYTVPENYVYITNDPIAKLGNGFIDQDIYAALSNTNVRFSSKDKSQSFYGDPMTFGYYYLLGIKGDGCLEIGATVKSLPAAQESVDIIRANNTIVGPTFSTLDNYYFYHYLVTSGEYYWDEAAWEFIPNNGLFGREDILNQNKNINIAVDGLNLGKNACSWGLSMDSLGELFTDPAVNYTLAVNGSNTVISFDGPIDGDTADFMYLEFSDMNTNYNYTLYDASGEIVQDEHRFAKYLMRKNYNPGMTVEIAWQDDENQVHTMNCLMSQGKLLIPLGSGTKWLLNNHSILAVKVLQDGVEIPSPAVSQIRFLKLQQVR